MVRMLVVVAAGLACTACAVSPLNGTYAGPQLSPLYNVTPDMQRPDGTLNNGLMPENPDDQS